MAYAHSGKVSALLRAVFSVLLTICLSTPLAVSAQDLAKPTGEVLLSVTGDISRKNTDAGAEFDLAMLQELQPKNIATNTIWTEGMQQFTGVLLVDLLRQVGANGAVIGATAINDYRVDIPLDDPATPSAIVAYTRNGAPMSIRDKGPLWIVFPYDSSPEFQSEVIYARSIWQLDRLHIGD